VTAGSHRDALATEVIATARAMGTRGINHGTSGNVSARSGSGLLITPSSMAYDDLTPDDIVEMDLGGEWRVTNDRRPSSEWRFHLDVLAARPDAGAVVHAHPINATALACHRRGISSFHYMVAVAGGHDIRCAEYATFGTPELSANVVAALEGRRACLMANHGVVAIGSGLEAALDVAVEVEVLASQYLAALAIGEPTELTVAEMDEVLVKMSSGAGYGST
jgi:L-fuculose-phosphate aldolase